MRCSHCGAQLPDDAVFCIACHSMLGDEGKPSGTPAIQLDSSPRTPPVAVRQPLFSPKAIYLLIGGFVLVAGVTAVLVYCFIK